MHTYIHTYTYTYMYTIFDTCTQYLRILMLTHTLLYTHDYIEYAGTCYIFKTQTAFIHDHACKPKKCIRKGHFSGVTFQGSLFRGHFSGVTFQGSLFSWLHVHACTHTTHTHTHKYMLIQHNSHMYTIIHICTHATEDI